ncbi:hypothetical protein RCG19_10470 [Neobacillus sp. OS1-2]|uniref:hypothetical protein n=1 Tax=Neobacillus sp. OS1-2 TaxID=3070680 RepID=UPI0027E07C6D|nr:hypothetical protein [Neobacillus sp. OS1-2]WML42003.1 hypothetical protein RCG19_10470 [Neobacillus sp. OS1-2]
MYIKAVREDLYNTKGTQKYEVGKEYKADGIYFSDEKNIAIIADTPGLGRENILKTRFLQIDSIDPPYEYGVGEFTSNHIKVIREIPTAEIINIFKAHGKLGHFEYFEQIKK